MTPVKSFGERIADALIEDKLLTTAQVEELLALQKKEGTRLLKLLIDKAYVSDTDMSVAMGRVLNVPPVNVARVNVAADVAALIPKEMAMNFKVVPVARVGSQLHLAMADPLNVLALDDVKRVAKLEVVLAITAGKGVIAFTATQDVVACVTKQTVRPGLTIELVRPRIARQPVRAAAAC